MTCLFANPFQLAMSAGMFQDGCPRPSAAAMYVIASSWSAIIRHIILEQQVTEIQNGAITAKNTCITGKMRYLLQPIMQFSNFIAKVIDL